MQRAVAGLLAAGLGVLAQQEPTFRVDVQLVRLLATVKDNYGRPLGDLQKEQFTVFENKVRQEIALFERYTEQPLSVAILIDISGSTAKEMPSQTAAVTRFLQSLFGEGNPDDQVALYAFNWQVESVVPYSRNLNRFQTQLKRLKAEAGTAMYDAILLASEGLAERSGRHVVILISDGGDTVSTTGYAKALQAVHAADAVIYPILTVPITNDAGRNVGGEHSLTTMAQTTGGRLFAPGMNGLNEAFTEILRDLRTQYLLGYYPRGVPLPKDPFHRIEIRVNRPDLRVVSRTGYYGVSEKAAGSSR